MTWHILAILLFGAFLLGAMFGVAIAAWMHASKILDRNFPTPPPPPDTAP